MPTLSEALRSFQKASSCRGCGRLPSLSNHCIDGAHNDNDDAGALLVSNQCGDMFCADCWKRALPKCPICHCEIESPPKPIISTLIADSKVNAFEKLALSTDEIKRRCNRGEFSSLIKVLNSITGDAVKTRLEISDEDNDGEVPGTFHESHPHTCGESSPAILKGTTKDVYKRQYTPMTGKKSESSETPTVRESQVKSLGTNSSSILNSVDGSKLNDETQTIPGTYFTPLHTSSNSEPHNNAQLNYFIDNMEKIKSPIVFSESKQDFSHSIDDESEVEGTYLSQFKSQFKSNYCRKKIDDEKKANAETKDKYQIDTSDHQLNNNDKTPEPFAERRCIDSSPNEAIVEISSQKVSKFATQNKQLYVAYDVLNGEECEALSSLCNEKRIRVLSDIIPVLRGGIMCPLPTILITHAIEKPRFGKGTPTRYNSVATCHRTFSYLQAMVLGARIVDAQWLKDCHKSGNMICCDSYSVWSDLETYNKLVAADIKIEGSTIRGAFQYKSRLKLDGAVFGFLDTDTNRSDLPALSSDQLSLLVEYLGGRVSEDSFTTMHAIMAHDCATLDEIILKLKECLRYNRNTAESWSIEEFKDDELCSLINSDGTFNNVYSDDYNVPVIRAKWLEDSICLDSLQNVNDYCIGVLCFEFEMETDAGERQTLLC